MNTPKRPRALLAVAQGVCAVAVPITLLCGLAGPIVVFSYLYQVDLFQYDNTLLVALMAVGKALRDLLIAAMLVWVEAEAFCVCGRVRKASAFCQKNEKGLGHIALALCIAGMISLLFGDSVMPFLLSGLPGVSPVVERLLLPFMLLTLAGMLRAVQLLMRRALTMQTENDLTV